MAQQVIEALAGRTLELGVWLDLEWSNQRALGAAKVKESAWQYSSKGRVPGIVGNVDMNIWYGSVAVKPASEPERSILWDTEAVRSLQAALNANDIRDTNGKTLQVDGIKGSLTDSAMEKILLKAGALDESKGRYTVGSTGQTVMWIQMRLNTVIGNDIIKLHGKPLNPDRQLGADIRLAVGLFQEVRGLTRDYIVGVKTVTELLRLQ